MENFDTNDLIEAYLDGSLSPDEIKAVEARMAADPAFLAEVDLHRRLQQEFADPQKLQLRDLMSDILREIPVPPEATPLNWLKILGIVLAVLLGAWAIWQIALPRQKNAPTLPTRQEEQTPQNQPMAGKDSLSKRTPQAPRGPIAMADQAAFKPNPMFEARVGNGGIRSTDDKVVEMKSPALGADFTPANGRVQIRFSGSVLADGDTAERPLRLQIFASQAAENPVSQFSPAIVNHNKAADHWTFSAVQKLRLPAGLYYFTVERQAEEALIYVGKFTVGAKMQ